MKWWAAGTTDWNNQPPLSPPLPASFDTSDTPTAPHWSLTLVALCLHHLEMIFLLLDHLLLPLDLTLWFSIADSEDCRGLDTRRKQQINWNCSARMRTGLKFEHTFISLLLLIILFLIINPWALVLTGCLDVSYSVFLSVMISCHIKFFFSTLPRSFFLSQASRNG